MVLAEAPRRRLLFPSRTEKSTFLFQRMLLPRKYLGKARYLPIQGGLITDIVSLLPTHYCTRSMIHSLFKCWHDIMSCKKACSHLLSLRIRRLLSLRPARFFNAWAIPSKRQSFEIDKWRGWRLLLFKNLAFLGVTITCRTLLLQARVFCTL